ncbi:holo-ACP synthase [Metamycoplasma equirhinis]|uniref:holo-ACP synthase n=1 Tax=Metamycoplasma equirhinis TaxID=92402 RepID=UPI00359C3B3A
MIGIDLVSISRFKNISKRAIRKILHPNEINEYIGLSEERKTIYIASRWAIKEALFKVDNQFIFFNKIEILKSQHGKYLFKDFEISTSDEDNLIIAIVLKK